MDTIRTNVSLAPYTTFGIGGNAEHFVSVRTEEELEEVVAYAQGNGYMMTILGGGSNVLISDDGIRGLVIHIATRGIDITEEGGEVLLDAQAGESFDGIVSYITERGWWGLENLSAIPGSVGAAPIQNIGAYGVEVCDSIEYVRVFDTKERVYQKFSKNECEFGYRDSLFKRPEGKRYIVTSVSFRLSQVPKPILTYKDLREWYEHRSLSNDVTPKEIREAVCAIRARKFPDWHILGTAGSFFKNPTIPRAVYETLVAQYPQLVAHETPDGSMKVSLGWILEHVLKLRGVRRGRVGTYEGQALVFVNYGDASSQEMELFAHDVAQKVFDATGISIEWEVKLLA